MGRLSSPVLVIIFYSKICFRTHCLAVSMSTVEYCYSTDPEWASDAVVCTETGVELNFERLTRICNSGELPSRICIVLQSSPSTPHGGKSLID